MVNPGNVIEFVFIWRNNFSELSKLVLNSCSAKAFLGPKLRGVVISQTKRPFVLIFHHSYLYFKAIK